jgi:hypothetical protein
MASEQNGNWKSPERVLFLDDRRTPEGALGEFTVVRTVQEAMETVQGNPSFDSWSLDFVLSQTDVNTGLDFLYWAADHALDKWPGYVGVHSLQLGRHEAKGGSSV